MTVIDDQIWIVATADGIPVSNGIYRNIGQLFWLNKSLNPVDSLQLKSISTNGITGTISPMVNYISNADNKQFLYYPVLLKEPIVRDTLYTVVGHQLQPSVKLHLQGASGEDESKLLIMNIYRSGKYLFSEYSFKGEKYSFCIDLKTGKQMNMQDGFDDDFNHTGIAKLFPLKHGR